MKRHMTCLLALLFLLIAPPAKAFVPQTIIVDGVNDFDPSNLLDNDTADTQTGCAPLVLPMDLGKVYVTNDANFLYIGIEFLKSCYCDMNLGMALDIGTAGGGTTDAFGRRIGWAGVPFKPDYMIYDVTPTNCNSFNYEILYKDTLGTWQNRSTLINPSWGSGANGLGIVDSLGFKELKLPLSVLGVSTGTAMHLEFWTTQEGANKGPLDALCSDNVQMSRVGQTTYDTTSVVQMTCMFTYTVQNAVDAAPPIVQAVQAVGFQVLANGQFGLNTTKIDVQFNEPVDLTSAQTTGNYAYSGPIARTIVSAIRDAGNTSLVHLTLSGGINANASHYQITVTNVKDPANNTIVANGTTNVGGFFIQNVRFDADMALPLCAGTFAPSDTFNVLGSLVPLTFNLCANGLMTDANLDSVYTVTVPFCLLRNPGTGTGTASLEWKLSASCDTYENYPGNRLYTLNSSNGALVVLAVSWSDEDPANYTSSAVDVIFQVDATSFAPTPSDVITLVGSAAPLSFNQPGAAMLDNGVAPDAVSGDKIYTARVTFPPCTPKNVEWKVDYNGVYECSGQGNRGVFLNDEIYSTSNPIELPARGIDRCTVTDKAITAHFRVNMDAFNPIPSAPDTVAVMGDRTPLRFDYPEAAGIMSNNGVTPDALAGDRYFGRAVTFPDSTPFRVEFKYWNTGVFECAAQGNRHFDLDDVQFSTSNPQPVPGVNWDVCADSAVTSVPFATGAKAGADFAALRPVSPNPVVGGARFSFDLYRAGRVTLSVYDVTGRRVARLFEGDLSAGTHSLPWNGNDLRGARLKSGVYVYALAMGNENVTRRLIVTQ